MFKKTIIFLIPFAVTVFTGCGGSDKDEAPPTALTGQEHPDDKASRVDLEQKMRAAKGQCTEAFGPPMLAAAPIIFANPGISPEMLFGGGPGAVALAQTAPQQGECANSLNMAIYNITKMQNGRYWVRADVQKWFYGNIASIGDRVGSRIPPEALANPAFLSGARAAGMYLGRSYMIPQITDPKARFQATQELSRLPY